MPATTGLLISFESGDGAGKSTQLRRLRDWLAARGVDVTTTREPGGTELGVELRAAVLHGGHVGPRTEALLYATDRAHHVDTVVRPALERGKVVLTDRYIDSSVAYQGGARGLGEETVRQLSAFATGDLNPDLTVLIDMDPRVAYERATVGGADRIEAAGLEFQQDVREAFLRFAEHDPARFRVVDGDGSIEEVHARVVAAVTPLLIAAGHLPFIAQEVLA